MKRVVILGSTGSIGTQGLDIVRNNRDDFNVVALSCNSRIEMLAFQIDEFNPEAVCVGTEEAASSIKSRFPDVDVYVGTKGLEELVKIDADIVLNGLMGISGLAPTYEAIKSGKDIALANKETLVAGGHIIMGLAKQKDVKILPVDSEHSAIFQCLEGNRDRTVKRILLTASGGPFRGYSLDDLNDVTVKDALKHPNWSMGKKITVDSATMMNKGLEVIEARWLFDVTPEMIDVHVHPESIVHSMVEFCDTSIIAQMGLPDMRVPISFALSYPDRLPFSGRSLDFFADAPVLHFEKPDRKVFKCLDFAYEALKLGGSYTVALNGANEQLVGMFLEGEIGFLDIQNTLQLVMENHVSSDASTVEEILDIDKEARKAAVRLLRS